MASPRELSSMTGFGKGTAGCATGVFVAEMRSVNHRFFDFSIRLPRGFAECEPEIRAIISSSISRGRVDIQVNRENRPGAAQMPHFDEQLFAHLFETFQRVASGRLALQSDHLREAILIEALRHPEVLRSPQSDELLTAEKPALLEAVRISLEGLCAMRRVEGQSLAADLKSRLAAVVRIGKQISQQVGKDPAALVQRLQERLRKIAPEIQADPSRLAAEAALIAERVDVTEELVRLFSHTEQFERSLMRDPNGKKFDFLLQEIGREANTIASKAQDAAIQNLVIDAKLEIEKMREQVQNIE